LKEKKTNFIIAERSRHPHGRESLIHTGQSEYLAHIREGGECLSSSVVRFGEEKSEWRALVTKGGKKETRLSVNGRS